MEANIQTNTGLTDFLSTEALPKRTLDLRRGNINAIKALLEKEPEETVLFSDPRPFDNNGIIEKINFGIPVQLKRFVQIYESLEAIEIRKPYAKEFFNKLLDFADTGTVNFGNRDKLFKLFFEKFFI